MEGPGRKSAASLAVVPATPWTRPEPPETLGELPAAMWRAIVAGKPADWFGPDTAPLLEAFCTLTHEYRRSAAALRAVSPEDLAIYKPLAEVVAKLAKDAASLATKMRLTPQSRYTPGSAATASKKAGAAAKPWSA